MPEGQVLASQEFEDLGPPVASLDSEHGHSCERDGAQPVYAGREEIVALMVGWHSNARCSTWIDVEVPSDGVPTTSRSWHGRTGTSRRSTGRMASPGSRSTSNALPSRVTPGTVTCAPPALPTSWRRTPDNSVQWLARKIVADERFAEATVKFWWPAIMGSEVAEPPEDEEDADFEGLAARCERPGRGGRASCARISGRLLGPATTQSQGLAGRARSLEVVPRRHRRGHRCGASGCASRRRRQKAAHARGACAQDRRDHRSAVVARASAMEPRHGQWPNALTRQYRLALRRHRFGRNHGTGAGHHFGHGRGGQAAHATQK